MKENDIESSEIADRVVDTKIEDDFRLSGNKEIDNLMERLPYDKWTCPSCGNDTFELGALGRKSAYVVCTECGNIEHFGE